MLERTKIVLVRTRRSGNIGATCRAMANFGVRQLLLVDPQCDPHDDQAQGFAAHGKDVLAATRVVPDIPTALSDCTRVYALSGKGGFYRDQACVSPNEAARELAQASADVRAAFLLGPEDHGLLTTELLHADRIVTIPATAAYPILNLAAAATIVCYELHLAAGNSRPLNLTAGQAQLADDSRKQVMFAKLFDALDRVGFFFGQNPDHLRYALRHMLGRIDLTVNEADILIGLARQVRWYAEHHPDRRD